MAVVAEMADVFPNVSLIGDGEGHKGMFEGLMVPFTEEIQKDAKLSFVSAYFTIYAYAKMNRSKSGSGI